MSIVNDATLLKMAEAEILGEAKRAAIRHSIAGISGWQPCPKPNKMFLRNTLLHAMVSNRILGRDVKSKGKKDSKCKKNERKLLQKSNQSDLKTNYIYQKPMRNKEKPRSSSKSNKYIHSAKSESKNSKNTKEFVEKFSNKKIKFKKD